MAETRRKFDEDFKRGAVQLVFETGKPIAQVARDLGINEGTLGNWVNADRRRRCRSPSTNDRPVTTTDVTAAITAASAAPTPDILPQEQCDQPAQIIGSPRRQLRDGHDPAAKTLLVLPPHGPARPLPTALANHRTITT